MKCIGLSFLLGKSSREKAASGVLEEIRKKEDIKGRLVFLPGNDFDTKGIPVDISWAENFAKRFEVNVIAEGKGPKKEGNKFFFISPAGEIKKETTPQVFGTSKEATEEECGELCEDYNGKKRTFKIGKKYINTIICGENNIAANCQLNGNKAKWRYDGLELIKATDFENTVLFNPVHSLMGNYDKIDKRFKFFTDKGTGICRMAVAVGNRYKKDDERCCGVRWPSRGFALYQNGERRKDIFPVEIGGSEEKKCLAYMFEI